MQPFLLHYTAMAQNIIYGIKNLTMMAENDLVEKIKRI